MMKRLTLTVAALALWQTTALHAEPTPPRAEPRLSPAFGKCIKSTRGVTDAMRDCTAQEYERLDRELNETWRVTMARVPDDRARSRLRQLQREWIKTRWAECDQQVAQSGMGGGTGGLLIYDNCQLEVIARRLSWLEAYRP